MDGIYDLAIIGGGINGCGIARDAAGRGLSVYLCEQSDLASGTSSAATKLIHGGLRYLEYYEFRLVREALREREVLWRMAPHIIWPLRFVLPYHKRLRPAWLLRLGLFLYDHLGGRKLLPAPHARSQHDIAGKPLKPGSTRWASNIPIAGWRMPGWSRSMRAMRWSAAPPSAPAPRSSPPSATLRSGGSTAQDRRRGGKAETVAARVLVNAAGPWVGEVLSVTQGRNAPAHVRLVQGSHIVVRRLYEHDRCYIFQNADDRIIFVIPFEGDFTLIGTTDSDYAGDPGQAEARRRRDRVSLPPASEYFAATDHAGGRRLDLFRRPPAL